MTQYLPGDWLWNILAENILCDENGVHLFPWKQTFAPSLHRILSKENLEIKPRIYLFSTNGIFKYTILLEINKTYLAQLRLNK